MNSSKENITLGKIHQDKGQYEEAFKYYKLAGDASDARGQFFLGIMYKNGWGVEQDYAKAVIYYKKSSSQGNSSAKVNLGWMYENGCGVEKSLVQASDLYKQAARKEHPTALFNLGDLCSESSDYAQAYIWYHKAAYIAHSGAQFKLAKLYRNGLGVLKDLQKFWYWCEQAASNNHKEAIRIVQTHRRISKAIQCDDFSCVELFSEANLSFPTYRENCRETYYHLLAAKGKINLLPNKCLSTEVLGISDSSGKTPLHLAAENKSLDQIPPNLLEEELLKLADRRNYTVVDLAFLSGSITQLPYELRFISNDFTSQQLEVAIRDGQLDMIPSEFISPRYLSERISEDEYGNTYVHHAARYGILSELPTGSLTGNILELRNKHLRTPLHVAAQFKNLHLVPHVLFSSKSVLAEDDSRLTVLDLAYNNNDICQIPQKLQWLCDSYRRDKIEEAISTHSIENLASDFPWNSPFEDGSRPIHKFAKTGLLYLVPTYHLDKKTLLTLNADNQTALDLAYISGSMDCVPEQIRWSHGGFKLGRVKDAIESKSTATLPSEFDWVALLDDGYSAVEHFARAGLVTLVQPDLISKIDDNTHAKDIVNLAYSSGDITHIPEPLRYKSDRYYFDQLKVYTETLDTSDLPGNHQWNHVFEDGDTVLHKMAELGALDTVPIEHLSSSNLSNTNNDGLNVVDLAYNNSCLDQIPKPLWEHTNEIALSLLSEAIGSFDFSRNDLFTQELLKSQIFNTNDDRTYYHWICELGYISNIPKESLNKDVLSIKDKTGTTPFHLAVRAGQFKSIPTPYRHDPSLLEIKNRLGYTCYHYAAEQTVLSTEIIDRLTPDTLKLETINGINVADLIDQFGNTQLLPRDLQFYSRKRALRQFQNLFETNFPQSKVDYYNNWSHLIPFDEFKQLRNTFVQNWVRTELYSNPSEPFPDDEQAEAIAETGIHIKVTARAGSGKTETLVARAIFLIKHCHVPANEMLILAFNRKAVSELAERLTDKLGAKNTPHVRTFHSLAHSIVNPSKNSIVFNDNDQQGRKELDNTIEQIIRTQLRKGTALEEKLQELMMQNWEKSLATIIAGGFNLPNEEFLKFRKHLSDKTIDLKTVNSEQERWIGNFLYARDLDYSYNRSVIYTAPLGTEYCALFRHWSKTRPQEYNDIVIELESNSKPSLSEILPPYILRKYNIIQIPQKDQDTSKNTISFLESEFNQLEIRLEKLKKKQLWIKLHEDLVTEFTKAVQSFIARCQKELIWADDLGRKIAEYKEKLDNDPDEDNQHIPLFWSMCENIYKLYEEYLDNEEKTDYDRLIFNASRLIDSGSTQFSLSTKHTISGDLSSIQHFLLDEFQDFSHLFNALREAIIKINSKAYFFCVGDDWQAINRFSGSNLQYFRDFHRNLTPSINLAISTNYRSSPEIVDLGNRVMESSGIIARASKEKPGKIVIAESCKNCALNEKEANVVDTLGWIGLDIIRIIQEEWPDEEPADGKMSFSPVVVLSRNGTIYSGEKPLSLDKYCNLLKRFLPEWQRTTAIEKEDKKLKVSSISFSTTHSFKGKQGDCIILLSPKQYYPIHENNIYQTLFGDSLNDFIQDEQRLYYVGVTRAEHSLYILQEQTESSNEKPYPPFVDLSHLESLKCARLPSQVLCGNQVFVSIYNDPNKQVYNGDNTMEGTRAIKDIDGGLKESSFTYDGISKWKNTCPVEQLPDAISYSEFLGDQPWLSQATKIIVAFESDNIDCKFYLENGSITRLGRQLSKDQTAQLNELPDEYKVNLGRVLESLHIDHAVEWPEFGCDANECMIEVAWKHLKVGIDLPRDEYKKLQHDGWQIIPVEKASINQLVKKINYARNPLKKTLLILANSIKFGDRCVAGIEISEGSDGKPVLGNWIRPVDANHPDDSIYSTTAVNNKTKKPIKPLDCVEISFQEAANDPFHNEDWLINPDKQWVSHDHYTQDIFNKIDSDLLWETDEPHKIKPEEGLPTLKLLKNFDTLEVRYQLNDDTKPEKNDHEESTGPKVSCKLHLRIAGNSAILSVTDPLFRGNHQITPDNASHEEQVINLNPDKTIVIASLTKPHKGHQYLIAATIIELA